MDLQQLQQIINQGEGLRIEFKEATDTVPGSFYETVVSFSNTDGGVILLGVDDNGIVKGINRDATTKLQKDIITALNSRDCINPPVYVQPFTVEHPDGLVMVIQTPSSSQLHDHKGIIYSREFEVDIDITNNQHKVSDIYLRKRNFFTESIIYPHLKMEHLDAALFEKARQIIRNNKSDHPWLLVSDEQMLRDSTLWCIDFQTGEEGLTLAAALIFGKDSTIQSILPAYKVEAMVRILNKDRWDDRINPPLRTNLIDTYLRLKQFINDKLPEKFYLEGDQRIDLRDKIFREVIGNAIVHREYTSALSTEMIITDTEVRITNPNRAYFHGVINANGFNPHPKNPNIRKFFTSFGWTDEIGSGIRNTNKYLPLYVPGAKPVFIENDTFVTEIPLVFATLSKFADKWNKWLELNGNFSIHLSAGFTNIALPAVLSNASWTEVLLFLVPSWHKIGTQLKSLDWPVNQFFTKEEIEKVPCWTEKGTELLRKKAWYLIAILSLCTEPMKLKDLLFAFNYKNEKTFRDNYIKPLRSLGFISLTNEDKPTDPENKYIISEQGKVFLSGQFHLE
ncbi:MAG: putative DNA binding domain-containing protein [Dysgonamonadaceae bacterium]|jgi:ATP-dependent DNA helicase RecG|nr:putative DNA binding domain-containing protein [Dysgonamonadaceae bacterium]